MYGPNPKELLDAAYAFGTNHHLNCGEFVSEVYAQVYGFNPIHSFGLENSGPLFEILSDFNGDMGKLLDYVLKPIGFVETEEETGNISLVKGSAAITIKPGLHCIKSENGLHFVNIISDRSWKCLK